MSSVDGVDFPFLSAIHDIATSVQRLRRDQSIDPSAKDNQSVAQLVEQGDAPVRMVTQDLVNIVKSVKAALYDGLRGRGRGVFGPLTTFEPTVWPFLESITPDSTLHAIREACLLLQHPTTTPPSGELLELAWILQMCNDGTLADYIGLIRESPLETRLQWYSASGNAPMLDNVKVDVLREAALIVCEIWFDVRMEDF